MSAVRLFVYQPAGILSRYAQEILWVRSERPRVQVLLPETRLTLVLRQSGAASLRKQALPNAVVSGLQQQTRIVEHAADSSLIVIRFTEVGAPAFLHDRADLLYNQTLPLDSVVSTSEIERIQNTLADRREIKQQVLAVKQFLASRIRPTNASSSNGICRQIEAAVSMIRNSRGRSSIAAIARQAAMSQSALERHFRAAVGTTPKMLSRLARLQYVCNMWDKGKSLTEIAFEAGYTDQPHMVRDFRLFTGVAPEAFFLKATTPSNLPIFYK